MLFILAEVIAFAFVKEPFNAGLQVFQKHYLQSLVQLQMVFFFGRICVVIKIYIVIVIRNKIINGCTVCHMNFGSDLDDSTA